MSATETKIEITLRQEVVDGKWRVCASSALGVGFGHGTLYEATEQALIAHARDLITTKLSFLAQSVM